MPPPTITSKIHKSLDIHGNFTPSITLYRIFIFNNLPDTGNIITTQIITIHRVRQICFIKDLPGRSKSYTMNISKCTVNMFIFRKVNP